MLAPQLYIVRLSSTLNYGNKIRTEWEFEQLHEKSLPVEASEKGPANKKLSSQNRPKLQDIFQTALSF